MHKIDLHQDIIGTYQNNLESFKEKQDPSSTSSPGGYPNYKESDIQIVWASIRPYQKTTNSQDPNKFNLQYSFTELVNQWKKYENLRKQNDIGLLKNSETIQKTRYIDYKLNFVYHLKGADGFTQMEEFEKIKNAGIRSVQLAWEFDNKITKCYKSPSGGLSEFGLDVIEYLEKNKIIIDTANMNYDSMIQTYQFSKKPIMNSHTNIKKFYNHSRNITDEFLTMIQQSEGLIGLSINDKLLTQEGQESSIQDFLNQIEYVKEKVGNDHIGLGTGYHGIYYNKMLKGLENISNLNILEKAVVEKFGYKFAEKFFWENAYRFLIQNL